MAIESLWFYPEAFLIYPGWPKYAKHIFGARSGKKLYSKTRLLFSLSRLKIVLQNIMRYRQCGGP